MVHTLTHPIAKLELAIALILGMFGGYAVDQVVKQCHRTAQVEMMISLPLDILSCLPVSGEI